MDVLGLEDGFDVRQWLQPSASSLIVDHANALVRCPFMHKVEPVYAPTDFERSVKRGVWCVECALHVVFKAKNGEWSQSSVNLQ